MDIYRTTKCNRHSWVKMVFDGNWQHVALYLTWSPCFNHSYLSSTYVHHWATSEHSSKSTNVWWYDVVLWGKHEQGDCANGMDRLEF